MSRSGIFGSLDFTQPIPLMQLTDAFHLILRPNLAMEENKKHPQMKTPDGLNNYIASTLRQRLREFQVSLMFGDTNYTVERFWVVFSNESPRWNPNHNSDLTPVLMTIYFAGPTPPLSVDSLPCMGDIEFAVEKETGKIIDHGGLTYPLNGPGGFKLPVGFTAFSQRPIALRYPHGGNLSPIVGYQTGYPNTHISQLFTPTLSTNQFLDTILQYCVNSSALKNKIVNFVATLQNQHDISDNGREMMQFSIHFNMPNDVFVTMTWYDNTATKRVEHDLFFLQVGIGGYVSDISATPF